MKKLFSTVIISLLAFTGAQAQLSSNPDKFLGNITTSSQVDFGNEKFNQLWNQITPENETKWDAIEPSRGNFTFGGADRSANYAKQHNFPFKYHTFIWGAQYPKWMDNLSTADQYKAIVEYFDAVKAHYPNLEVIDVVNEAINGHQPAPYRAALGGEGRTGFDWIIKAFQLAHERWPNAILVYNDYNTFQWQKNEFINLVRTLRDAGAPIDAYGCQSHDITDMSLSTFKSAMSEIQNALKIPMYSTEFDIGTADDQKQLTQYKNLIPVLWEADYCAGITLWGYIYGRTWTTDGNSGLIRDGKDRPAMTWLRQYMQSDKAKTAKSPFPGFKKEASIYIRPASLKVAKGDVLPIKVRARLATKTIEKVDLYVGNQLVKTMTEAPYIAEYTTSATGWNTTKAVVTATDGSTYERYGRFNVLNSTVKREPYNETVPQLPGTIKVIEYDKGASGVSYSNASRSLSVTKDGAWMEYTVDVAEDGIYSLDAEVAAAKAGGMFHLAEYSFDNLDYLTEYLDVPNTGGANNYQTMRGLLKMPLTAGRHVLCLNIDKGGFYIKNLTFSRYEIGSDISVAISSVKPTTINFGDSATITITTKSTSSTIDNVKLYANNLLIATLTEAPYTYVYYPAAKGTYTLEAIATNAEGKSKISAKKTLKVNGKREPYKDISLPGIVQFEDFDKGGEGMTFHDSDDTDQGDAKYRTDNEGVDIVKGNGGSAIGYTAKDEWLEYTVNVTKAGTYNCEATVSSGTTGASFTVSLRDNGQTTQLCSITIPQTASSSWDTYTKVSAKLSKDLPEGKHILRVTITGANGNLDKMAFTCDEGGDEPSTADPNFHIYLCFGQSNMEGNAQWESVDSYVDPRFQMLATTDFTSPKRTLGQWYTAKCPIVSPVGKLGMADYFGRTMVAAMPKDVKIGVVAVAMGGSPIEMFDKDKYQQKLSENPNEWWAQLSNTYYGGNPYGRLIDMAKEAQKVGVIKGILLHQGCTNCGDPNWPNMVKKIYTDMLSDLNLKAADVPLFVGETEQKDMGGGCYGHNVVVNQVPNVIPTAHVVHSNGVPGNGQDQWHFSAAGYRTFGKRYAIEALKAMNRPIVKDAAYTLPSNLVKFFTLTNLENATQTVHVGANENLRVWGTFADGHREDLSNEVLLTAGEGVTITGSSVKVEKEGIYTVTATYSDFIGTQHTAAITIEAVGTGIDERFTDLATLTANPSPLFAIVNEDMAKAFYCSDNQNLYFDDYSKAFDPAVAGYYFKLEKASGTSYYLFRLYKADGTPHVVFGGPGYLNSQEATGWCSFILGLNNQNGQDIKNGALWDVKYVENKGFTLKNIGTGKYLQDAAPAKYDTPSYFTFCTIGTRSNITPLITDRPASAVIYTLQGVKAGTTEQWSSLPKGIYVVNGKLKTKK